MNSTQSITQDPAIESQIPNKILPLHEDPSSPYYGFARRLWVILKAIGMEALLLPESNGLVISCIETGKEGMGEEYSEAIAMRAMLAGLIEAIEEQFGIDAVITEERIRELWAK